MSHSSLPSELSTREAKINPYPWFSEMRSSEPVRYDGSREIWDVFKYDHSEEVLTKPDTFSSNVVDSEIGPRSESITFSDPPRHDMLRNALGGFFQSSTISEFDSVVRTEARRILNSRSDSHVLDVMDDYGFPVSVFSLAELFGIPSQDRELFLAYAWKLLRGRTPDGDPVKESNSSASDPRSELLEYFSELLDERYNELREGIILHLLNETSCDSKMSKSDVISNCDMMMVGGFVPALHLTNLVYCLDEQEGVLSGTTPSTDTVQKTVEESFRYRSAALAVPRLAKSSTRLGGREISKGDQLMIWIASANRDGDVFDRSESFVVDRDQNNHLAFGAGIHYCIGAQIARMEARIMISELLHHIEQISVRDDGTTPYMDPVEFGFDSLPIDGN